MRERMVSTLIVALVVVSILSLPQTYAKQPEVHGPGLKPTIPTMQLISSVTNPSGSCGEYRLVGSYGDVMTGNGRVLIILQNAHPSSSFSVSVDKMTQGKCDGSWQSVGSLSTDQGGNGMLAQKLNLQASNHYVFAFRDTQGNLVYATS